MIQCKCIANVELHNDAICDNFWPGSSADSVISLTNSYFIFMICFKKWGFLKTSEQVSEKKGRVCMHILCMHIRCVGSIVSVPNHFFSLHTLMIFFDAAKKY